MTPWPARDWWPLAWVAAFAGNVVAAVVAVVAGNWGAVFGWVCAALGALGAAGSGALLVHTYRELGAPAMPPPVGPRQNENPPGWDDWNGH